MEITTTKPPSLKADAIARCVNIVAHHFDIDPFQLAKPQGKPHPMASIARQCLWYHLHACGMSWRDIGEIWKRSVTIVQEGARMGCLRLDDKDRSMMARLPRIPSSLNIQHVEGSAPSQNPNS